MKENHVVTHGELVDRGPRRKPATPEHSASDVTRITRVHDEQLVVTSRPYSDAEIAEVVRQGRDNPRRLTLEESRRASQNRTRANEDLRAMETWAAAEL